MHVHVLFGFIVIDITYLTVFSADVDKSWLRSWVEVLTESRCWWMWCHVLITFDRSVELTMLVHSVCIQHWAESNNIYSALKELNNLFW